MDRIRDAGQGLTLHPPKRFAVRVGELAQDVLQRHDLDDLGVALDGEALRDEPRRNVPSAFARSG